MLRDTLQKVLMARGIGVHHARGGQEHRRERAKSFRGGNPEGMFQLSGCGVEVLIN
jgi:hypothetical protein